MSTTPQPTGYIIPSPEGPNWRAPLVIGALALLFASNIYLLIEVGRIKTDTKANMAKLSSDISATVEQIRIDSSANVRKATRNVEALQSQFRRSAPPPSAPSARRKSMPRKRWRCCRTAFRLSSRNSSKPSIR